METLFQRCNNPECSVSTFIDEETLTFGSGELFSHGDWEKPCKICALAYLQKHPQAKVLPPVCLPRTKNDNAWNDF